ncbi:hypothetical protein DN069_09565 [Streptacidiphilus pinicola]|uniref:Uncharacterized protein n=1 Tax=Streptacidiphilus pinicola TaxID=2219663 RepID=A0A2X0KF49_9ACTN|nr:hypothetical protein [Streptacidiphilus pinicola]RAG85749.1 hypothetical protein DN069_09565 [Streptacidiphilus pinicola]
MAWVAREVADAGWHAVEVVAWLSLSEPPARVRRPSAFLAHRLKGAHLVAVTPAQRANLVEAWRDRHVDPARSRQEWEGPWQPPTDPAVRSAFARAMAAPLPTVRSAHAAGPDGAVGGRDDDCGPTRDEIAQLRAAALQDPSLVRAALETCGAEFAARVYTPRLVDLVRRAQHGPPGRARLRLHAVNGG